MNSNFNRRYSLIRKEIFNEGSIWRRRKRKSSDFCKKVCRKKRDKIEGLLEGLERMVKTTSEQGKYDKLREEFDNIIPVRVADIVLGRNGLRQNNCSVQF